MSSDVIDLFSGICVIIDESLNEETAVPNNIQKIENSLKENLIPIIKLSELPEDAFLQHLHSVSFIILDWNLTGLNPIPEVAIADNIDFIKKLRNYCYVPIFIFSDENVHAIIVKLEEEGINISNNVFVKAKSDLDSSEKLFSEMREWLKTVPSVYLLKEWERSVRNAKNEMFWDLSSIHQAWPNILLKTIKADGADTDSELIKLLQNNLMARLKIPKLNRDIIEKTIDGISKQDLRIILEKERFLPNLPDTPFSGDVYKIDKIYYINIRPDCDIIREKKDMYLLKGGIVDESKINSEEQGSIIFDSGSFVEKINSCYVAFIENKIIEFKFRKIEIKKWNDIKSYRIGRLLPPYITRIQQKYAFYLQRQALPALPIQSIIQ